MYRIWIKDSTLFCQITRKLKCIVVTFAKQHQEGNVNLEVQWKSTTNNQCCYFTLQNETVSEPLHEYTKMEKNCKKLTSLLAECGSVQVVYSISKSWFKSYLRQF